VLIKRLKVYSESLMPPAKYTTDQLRTFLTQGTIDPFLWMAHFPDVLDTKVPDGDDRPDFKTQICPDGKDPVDCFISRTWIDFFWHHVISGSYSWVFGEPGRFIQKIILCFLDLQSL
jgi:hypothetical protein